jgi:hypothetical protein
MHSASDPEGAGSAVTGMEAPNADAALDAYLDGLEEDEEAKRVATLAAHPPVQDDVLGRMVAAYVEVNEQLRQQPLDPQLSEIALRLQLALYYASYARALSLHAPDGSWAYTMRRAEFLARIGTGMDDVEYVDAAPEPGAGGDQEILDRLAAVEEDEEARRLQTLDNHPPISDAALSELAAMFVEANAELAQRPQRATTCSPPALAAEATPDGGRSG